MNSRFHLWFQESSIRERDIPISKPVKKPKARDLDKVLRAKSERRHKKESNEGHLDPMDPAAYSDIPRWDTKQKNQNPARIETHDSRFAEVNGQPDSRLRIEKLESIQRWREHFSKCDPIQVPVRYFSPMQPLQRRKEIRIHQTMPSTIILIQI